MLGGASEGSGGCYKHESRGKRRLQMLKVIAAGNSATKPNTGIKHGETAYC